MDVNKWNNKIYRNIDGTFFEGERLNSENLWNEFGIKSGPKFKDYCWSEIPAKWADDVRLLLQQVKEELGDRITFTQIKEKWCYLTIYYDAKDEEAKNRYKELEKECIDRLIGKEIHPSKDDK